MHRMLPPRALLPLVLLSIAAGCSTTRQITISAHPPDALIQMDGQDLGRGQATQKVVFKNKDDTHTVTVSRTGFQDQSVPLKRNFSGDTLDVDLHPLTRKVTINVTPVPAVLKMDGRPMASGPTDSASQQLDFTVNLQTNKWTTHTITAEHEGFATASRTITWQDPEPNYTIHLEPRTKDLTITTSPPGAQLFLDGEPLGNSPVVVKNHPFPVDLATTKALPQKLRAIKSGYEPTEMTISWDEGKTTYALPLVPRSKTVRITTNPPGGVVTINGKALPRDDHGVSSAKLTYLPVDEKGDLPSFRAIVTKQTADSEWYPKDLDIGWDAGRTDYDVALKEILTRPVPMLSAEFQRTDDGWQIQPVFSQTLAMKDVSEGSATQPPRRISSVEPGRQIGAISISPDGTRLLFTVLLGKTAADFRSQIVAIRTDGTGGEEFLTDGKSLEITPSFTPGGDQIVFASNRAGKHLSVWQTSASGAPGITQLTRGETNDLWPSIDSDPKPRLYYQAMVDTRPDPRLYMTQLGTTILTDLAQSGCQPRVSPKADSVLFTAVNEKTGKRDIFIMPDTGGVPRNLTNTPDIDEFDPAWNRDGNRIAFVSDAGFDSEHRKNLNIWTMELASPQRPTQVTTNGSYDDHPQWDPSGSAIYFRSNRGGEWGIWRINLK